MAGLVWPVLEAGDTPKGRVRDAYRTGGDIQRTFRRTEDETAAQLMTRLDVLQQALRARLTQQLTDFQRFNLTSLLADVDRMVADAQADIARDARPAFGRANDLGEGAATEPVRALQLNVDAALPGLDQTLVQVTFGNAVDLLTAPMQQFTTDVKAALRRVALAGDQKFEQIQRLQASIAGAGFDNAQYRAERIMRTELGRVFNMATFTKLVGLSAQFPFLKKAWRATPGSRTRKGHAEAGAKYARGQGIPIAQLFQVNVYDERPGKAAKLIGVAQLRFPIDPETFPAGRIAAGATIQCRCNAFVDIDVAAYSAFARDRVQLALGAPPAAPTVPRLPKPAKARLPKAPKVAKGKTAKALPAPAPVLPKKVGPAGTLVSNAARMNPVVAKSKIADGLALIDKVHGDGPLPVIPVTNMPSKGSEAHYASTGTGRPLELAFGMKMRKQAPMMGTAHEVGHFLDHAGLGSMGGFASDGVARPEAREPMKAVMEALKTTRTSRNMGQYREAIGAATGGVRPADLDVTGLPAVDPRHLRMVRYLNQRDESFARAYAQYVATRSQDPAALKELRNLQRAGESFANRTVAPGASYGYKGFSDQAAGQTPAGAWQLPWAWQDDEFAPVAEAFDRLFEAMGWRK